MGRIAPIGVAVAIALAGTAIGTEAAGTQNVEPVVFLSGGVIPKQLPRREPAPVEFSVSGDLRRVAVGVPPPLRELILEADRNGHLDVTGLPACGKRRLQSVDRAVVKAACRDAIVGSGTGEAIIAYPENSPMPAMSDLLVVNGGVKGRITTFFIWGAISAPIQEAVISTVKIEKVDQGRYGLRATVRIPPIADKHGSVTAFSLRLKKRYGYAGGKRSAFSARCADGKLQARTTLQFDNGSKLFGVALSTCGVKN